MSAAAARARILIVDDHPMMREGLSFKIASQRDLEVCGEAATEAEGFALVAETRPDLVIVDLALKEGTGLGLLKRIRASSPDTKTLVVSAYDEASYAQRCLEAGAMGYISKQETNALVLEAIRTVLNGERFLTPAATQQLVARAVDRKASGDPVQLLSDREFEVFRLIGRGLTTRAIAQRLQLSVHTIETHRERIRHKLDLPNGAELTRRAVTWVLERDPA